MVSTFKTNLENIEELRDTSIFKTDQIKFLTLLNPTIIGEVAVDGYMQLLANAEANDDNLSLNHVNIFIIIDKKRGENSKLAIVFNIAKGVIKYYISLTHF